MAKQKTQAVKSKNFFSALESDSSSSSEEEEVVEEVEEAVPAPAAPSAGAAFRKWNRGEEARFTTDSTANIFSSPFYKGRRPSQKHWTKPRFVEDTDGWVSIRQGNEAEGESEVIYEKRPSAVEQHVPAETSTPDGETVIFPPEEEAVTASMWAERIKSTLEKAEATRGKPKESDDFKESLNRLSFFRRSIV